MENTNDQKVAETQNEQVAQTTESEEAVDFGFADKVLTRTEYLNVREIKKRNNRGTK